MAAPTPKPKTVGIFDEVNEILSSATHYLSANDERVQRLLREAQSSIKVNAAEAYSVKGSIYQLTGEHDQARYSIDNAIKLAPSNYVYLQNKCAGLVNLGFFLEAQQVFDRLADPKTGFFTRAWNMGYVCGAFASMTQHLEKALRLGLDLSGLDIMTAPQAARVLKKAGLTDADIGSTLDAVGALLRENRLFYLGQTPTIRVFDKPDQDSFIEMSYDVGIAPAEAHALYKKFVDQMMRNSSKASSALSVSFRARGMERERSAA